MLRKPHRASHTRREPARRRRRCPRAHGRLCWYLPGAPSAGAANERPGLLFSNPSPLLSPVSPPRSRSRGRAAGCIRQEPLRPPGGPAPCPARPGSAHPQPRAPPAAASPAQPGGEEAGAAARGPEWLSASRGRAPAEGQPREGAPCGWDAPARTRPSQCKHPPAPPGTPPRGHGYFQGDLWLRVASLSRSRHPLERSRSPPGTAVGAGLLRSLETHPQQVPSGLRPSLAETRAEARLQGAPGPTSPALRARPPCRPDACRPGASHQIFTSFAPSPSSVRILTLYRLSVRVSSMNLLQTH